MLCVFPRWGTWGRSGTGSLSVHHHPVWTPPFRRPTRTRLQELGLSPGIWAEPGRDGWLEPPFVAVITRPGWGLFCWVLSDDI